MPKASNSKLILGTVQMGLPYGINNTTGKIALQDSLKILDFAFDNGIQILDTAGAYGNAHQVIGSFHEVNTTKQFKIITKLPNKRDKDISEKVSDFLNELKVDSLYALLFHSFSSYKNSANDLGPLLKLKSEKIIEKLGVSVYTNSEIEEVLLNREIDIIQVPFNLLDNNHLRGEILKKARATGKIIHTRSALLQGLFFRRTNDKHKTVQQLKDELVLLSDISKKYNVSMSKLALSYCLNQNHIDNVLVGVDTIDQLRDNIEAVNYEIKEHVIKEINAIQVKNPDLINPSLWK